MSKRVVERSVVVTGSVSDEMGELTALLSDIDGFSVETVPERDLADHLSTADPDAVAVVDDPPASDGVSVFADVRGSGAELPVVLVGPEVTPDRVREALSAGVTDYITTGGDTRVAELAARIRAHVEQPVLDGYVEARRWERTIGSLAHDMKNPLNVVAGRLELLDIEATHGDAVERSIRRVESLIDEVSLVASAGRPECETQQVDLAGTARAVWADLATDTATLVVETNRTVDTDEDALELLFRRLFENALGHGGEDVTVTLGDAAGGFYVADDGPGLPEDAGERVFEQGYGTARDGEGYGLFVASRVASANGWALSAGESESGGARLDVQYR